MTEPPPPPASADRPPTLPVLMEARLNARSFAWKLGFVVLVLALLHGLFTVLFFGDHIWDHMDGRPAWLHYRVVGFFDLDNEESFGTYFTAAVMFLIARLLWHEWKRARARGEWTHAWWLVLCLGFHFLSLDEVLAIHESLNDYLKDSVTEAGGTLEEADRWTKYGLAVYVAVAVFFSVLLVRLRWRTAIWFAVGGALYGLGELGIEKWCDWYENQGLLNTMEYHVWILLEETLAMTGLVVFLHALLAHISGHWRGDVELRTRVQT